MSMPGGGVTGEDCTIAACSRASKSGPPGRFKEAPVKLPHERFDYSPIVGRRRWTLPKGARIAGWEFMGHGVVQGAMHLLSDQREAIRQAISILQKFTGKKPKGWLGPGLTETWETLDLLAQEGIEYVSDWVNDDQPYELRTTAGRLGSVPYTIELNDIPMMIIQPPAPSGWLQRCPDPFGPRHRGG